MAMLLAVLEDAQAQNIRRHEDITGCTEQKDTEALWRQDNHLTLLAAAMPECAQKRDKLSSSWSRCQQQSKEK
eukprot:m.1651162 g.1651162  ORF g.1651162 m.1651162 type:complete len:73 (-) comp89539_c0_seq1:16-234(-)